MAVRRVKKKEGENITPENVEKVISLLSQAKPITKKEACEILNISYNTTRLGKIIEEHKHQKALDEKRRAANRGKPASNQEIQDTIESYLEGESVKDIADRLYRSTTFVRNIVDSVGVPQRKNGQTYVSFDLLPEQCISDRFEPGEIVWSSRFQAAAEIIKEYPYKSVDGLSNVYQIYVLEKIEKPAEFACFTGQKVGISSMVGGFYASQPAYDLGKLTHLREYGVNIRKALNATQTRTSNSSSGD